MRKEKSVTIERNKRGAAITLVSAGMHYPVKGGSFEIPKEIAGTFVLGDLTPEIIIDFVEKHEHGIVSRAIQQVKGSHGEVVIMVRNTLDDWNGPVSLEAYSQVVETLVKSRANSRKDVVYLTSHIRADHGLVAFVAKVNGTAVSELLINARKIAEEIISPLKKVEQKVDEAIKMVTSSATDGGAGSKQNLKKK